MANPNPSSSSSSASSAPSVPPALAPKKTTQEEALLSEERRIDELDLPRHEVVRRLRVLREPVTLFGEDDDARLARFKLVLKSGHDLDRAPTLEVGLEVSARPSHLAERRPSRMARG